MSNRRLGWVLAGVFAFFEKVALLPPASLSAPGTSGSRTVTKRFTVVLFASVGSMVQPAQWMPYCAARSTGTRHLPEILGPAGILITAASMSTAHSNLHALSALLARDVDDRFLRQGVRSCGDSRPPSSAKGRPCDA